MTVFEWLPERATSPCAIVAPAEQYLTFDAAVYQQYSLNVTVLLVAGKGTNKSVTTEIDNLIEQAVSALQSNWDISSVSSPGAVSIWDGSYLGCAIELTRPIQL